MQNEKDTQQRLTQDHMPGGQRVMNGRLIRALLAAALAGTALWNVSHSAAARTAPLSAAERPVERATATDPTVNQSAVASAVSFTSTSAGRDFWLAFPRSTGYADQALIVYVAGRQAATGRISIKENTFAPIDFTVTPGQVTKLELPGTLVDMLHPANATNGVSDTPSYTAEVANAVSTVVVTPTLSDPNAAYTITGSPGTCTPATSPANCALNVGVNVITVTVTAEDGTTTKDYVVTITRAVSNDANLIDLTIDPGTLAPAFVSSTNAYEAGVPNGTTSTAVTATPSDANATVTYESSAGACAVARGDASVAPTNCAVAGPKTAQPRRSNSSRSLWRRG